ncbi:conserved hypothetical protein [Vibrio nigripulchritudo SFn27]|uniref:Uncharacterized protein n=1 Tax=Vibrio nigripulchritudo TaxID=28173 RepID=U4K4T7_9VIBR|nr:hypothetical protein [Vibrio nigripulchritudo]CCN82404.1 conserved hypothetical protein [Vibrio nigripulchritudo BLFn1]CCN91390.1 conserved hypothetical protein [Vibrio nigripulchritudo SFn27]CCN97555.1 conserved hypothetical protein [Vibrio nigripulchritudo ENn2]CCO38697.1 conserved hypothetical protein [Vibrio nigripulchritudo SFn135]CCO55102.1 conserved hypothetical protein [Vibrio nigripulchritudo Wn13]
MNIDRLKAAETDFLIRVPGGFNSPEMIEIGKKHKMDQMIAQAQEAFSEEKFTDAQGTSEMMTKMVSRSSMVSMFEKPKFRDYVKAMTHQEREALAYSLKDILHGDQEYGFNTMLDLLRPVKLAKWSLVTILPNYYAPLDEVFVKPTTAKGVIKFFELKGLEYKPAPTWDFYQEYRKQILEMRKHVSQDLSPNNAAFCGFLMMTMDS